MKFDLNPEGWIWWPEREDLSLEFMRLLAAAQDGGSTVSECWLTASRIDLAWGAATDDVGVTGYRVERCTAAACSTFAQIATPLMMAAFVSGWLTVLQER